ncbi:MAG: PorV/PorQ family protein [Longimicrobiales bacterium]
MFGGATATHAQDDGQVPSAACCVQLLAAIGARALALGDAVVARTGPGSLFGNPAALADVEDDQFVVHTSTTAAARSNTFSLLIHSEIVGTIGVSYLLVDLGEIQATDAQGNVTGEIGLLEHALTATYATRVGRGLRAGLSYQLFQRRQDCRGFCNVESYAATTHLVDAGLQYTPAFLSRLELGASLLHLGFPLQVKNAPQAAPTPTRLRLGAAHEVLQHVQPDSALQVWLSADLITAVGDLGDATLNVGAEMSLDDRFFVWLGYGSGAGVLGGPALGVGLELDRFSVGVARSFVSSPIEGSDPFQVTFGIRF